jgi:hypothetical protein
MKPPLLVLMLASVGMAGAAPPALAGSEGLAQEIESVSKVLLSETQPSRAVLQKGLTDLLRCASRISAAAELPTPAQERLDAAVASYDAGGFLGPETRATVRRAYQAVTGGHPFVFPESVGSIEEARDYGRGQIERALAALDAGRSREAVEEVLGFVLLVITPMERPL